MSWQSWNPASLESFIGSDEPLANDDEDWIIRDVVPRDEQWLIAGRWKGGKTWLALDLAIHAALGRNWGTFRNTLGRPARVFTLTLEDGQRRISRRVWRLLRGIGATRSDLRDNLTIEKKPLRLPRDTDEFIRAMATYRPDVIIVDSLTRVMEGDQNSIGDASAFTSAWQRIRSETGASVAFLHHLNKKGSDVRGSGELMAAPRHILKLKKQSKNVSSVAIEGNMDGECNLFQLAYNEVREGEHVAVRLDARIPAASDSSTDVEPSDRGKLRAKERKALEAGETKSGVTYANLAEARETSSTNAKRDYEPTLVQLERRGLLGAPTKNGARFTTQAGRDALQATGK